MSSPTFDALVIGGGINGLATAYHLQRLGLERVALVEQFRFGHDRGSSHGASRITRSSYVDALYVRLMQVAHHEEWPRLERDTGRTLVHRCDGVFFGPAGGPLETYAAAVASEGVDVERIDPSEARRRFPQFRFPDAAGALHDRTGGLIAAADTLEALARKCSIDGLHALEQTRVTGIDRAQDPIAIATDRGTLRAARVVVTAGAWSARLIPELAVRLKVARQNVGYFRLAGGAGAAALGAFPVWVYLGAGENGLRYGLPEFGREGMKAAHHVVRGASDDPDDAAPANAASIEGVREFLDSQLARPVEAVLHAETCLFTNTATEDFVIDTLPVDPRILIGSACSGHGFKFGPLTGRLLAELAVLGHTTVPAFEAQRARFAIAR